MEAEIDDPARGEQNRATVTPPIGGDEVSKRTFAFYLSDRLVERVDEWRERTRRQTGVDVNRSQAVEALLARMLDAEGVSSGDGAGESP
jgi:hypothetical protein